MVEVVVAVDFGSALLGLYTKHVKEDVEHLPPNDTVDCFGVHTVSLDYVGNMFLDIRRHTAFRQKIGDLRDESTEVLM